MKESQAFSAEGLGIRPCQEPNVESLNMLPGKGTCPLYFEVTNTFWGTKNKKKLFKETVFNLFIPKTIK